MAKFEADHIANFETILRAARVDRLALLDCQDKQTGKPVMVIVAISNDVDDPTGEGRVMVPLARMFDGDPYQEIRPPKPDGGYADE